jgi:hypothetical protein
MKTLERFSLGIGDRFGREGSAQLAALKMALDQGVLISPVWNKSYREHSLIGTGPADTHEAALRAVNDADWHEAYHLDADHIGLKTVDQFLPYCDFFTIDVADYIGLPEQNGDTIRELLSPLLGRSFPELGMIHALEPATLDAFVSRYGRALTEAAAIYHHIAARKESFIAEVSTDEAETPQAPIELFLILGALAKQGVMVQTIAPKFTGRFNKGVDYVGDVEIFAREFEQDLSAIRLSVSEFGLPENLKISVHSGSDKFSLYRPIHDLLDKHGAGLHLKTAGTNWLEEVIGMALQGGACLEIAKQIYARALERIDELSAPYASVIDIDRSALPDVATARKWSGKQFAAALAHEPGDSRFNPTMRQLVHVSFKVAAEMGGCFFDALDEARDEIAHCVTDNLYRRHIKPLFL